MTAVPPLITHDKNYQSLQINNILQSHSPALNWNEKYNQSQPLTLTARVIDPITEVFTNNVIIDFSQQPFNYIEITTVSLTPQILELHKCPQTWISVFNNSGANIIISPQLGGFGEIQDYNPDNNYTLSPNTRYLLSIKPNATSTLRSQGEAAGIQDIIPNENNLVTVSGMILN